MEFTWYISSAIFDLDIFALTGMQTLFIVYSTRVYIITSLLPFHLRALQWQDSFLEYYFCSSDVEISICFIITSIWVHITVYSLDVTFNLLKPVFPSGAMLDRTKGTCARVNVCNSSTVFL